MAGGRLDLAFRLAEGSRSLPPLTIAGQQAELHLTAVSQHTLRLSFLPLDDQGKPRTEEDSLVLIPQRRADPFAQIGSISEPRTFEHGDLRVHVSDKPLALRLQHRNAAEFQRIEVDTQTGELTFSLGGAPIYGLGEGGPQFDRRGAAFPMRHGQRVQGLAVTGARLSIPWLLSAEGWALFFHAPFGDFELTCPRGRFKPWPSESVLPLDVFVVAAPEPAQIMREYAEMTGYPHLPPIWSLGYQQSHRTLENREEVLSEARIFREKKLPCDILIYLGTGFCPSGWNTGHGSFDFNAQVFPDPEQMIRELHQEHFRIVLHDDKPPRQLRGQVTDRGPAREDPEGAARYWQEHAGVFRLGVDGWWADEGDWLDNRSCLVRNRMYWEGSKLSRPDVRPYTLNRNGYAGLQRYGWLWSGDIDSTWEALRAQVEVGINTGLSGIPYWGTDTGGFVTSAELTGELYVRWFQFSAFCPLFRSHGRTWKLRRPWGWDTGDYGPTEIEAYHGRAALPDPAELHNAQVEPICRKYLDLRYQLLPYLYTTAREAHETGLPIMRALWFYDPRDPQARARGDEYLFGRDMLVAPIFEKSATKRTLYLPRGSWYDFWTEERIEGGREVEKNVDLATIPLYVRSGSILPLGPPRQFAALSAADPSTFVVYPGRDGGMALYEDDGVSFNYEQGEFSLIEAKWTDRVRRLAIRLEKGPKGFGPQTRTVRVRVAGEQKVQEIRFDGTPKVLQF